MTAIKIIVEERGWTVAYTRLDGCQTCVAGRFKTTAEKDAFLERINRPDSGWTPEELNSICTINDYNYLI